MTQQHTGTQRSIEAFAQASNLAWQARGLERHVRDFSSTELQCEINGQRVWQFASSDYAGLGMHPALQRAAQNAIATYGTTAGGSRLTTGLALHREAEAKLAAFFGTEDAVLFATGFQTNVSVLQAISDASCTIFSDALNHASIIDGARMTKASTKIFDHGDFSALKNLLEHHANTSQKQAIVVSDAVFSMTGEIIDLPRLRSICQEFGAWLVLDDAHGVGNLGGGKGILGLYPQRYENEIVIGTASKALGGIGGFVLCGSALGHLLRNRARSFVFSTANTPASTAALIAALDVLDTDPGPLQQLSLNIDTAYTNLGLQPSGPRSPIIPVVVGSTERALTLHQQLFHQGWFIPAIRYPTVPDGQAMLRLTITARHPRAVVAEACSAITQLLGASDL
ncbi:aminotransferase class I/II-fold pyridoxal phosphate-dependent enzyme [Corynebacterium pelargi]|uniref:8-amino-7-oxononanoate synthase n=1 Tax=Corynebacterium pelargi TaxID=1471400 RepID=A0A410W8H8_9CORY|nr:aminotransferase class I/II-fold pyridoxal phosphate-dependent enzyme [Corynebacterium pelargi]QAU52260.1 8-amino-7-oxononanoate synthase [Corynebacterium pelargi]GGG69011.1 8-amino-7-oxononanoate synthase [Corynebacterium pelargi]